MIAPIARNVLFALLWVLGSGALGLLVNHLRSDGIPFITPFPIEQDCPEKLPPGSSTVSAKQALSLAKSTSLQDTQGRRGVIFVDAREATRYAAGHLPGALNFPYSFVTPFTAEDGRKLAAYVHVFVYCDTPKARMAQVQAAQMGEAGLSTVKVVTGGWAALSAALNKKKQGGMQ